VIFYLTLAAEVSAVFILLIFPGTGTATDTPPNGIMRAPGDFQGMVLTEAAIEATITAGKFDEVFFKAANLGPEVQPVWKELDAKMGGQAARKAAVEKFNSANRWRKRGLWSIPVKYARGNREREMVKMKISAETGVVTVSASGIEMGQGLNTKVSQACAMGLSKLSPSVSVDVSLIHNTGVKTTADFPAASGTSGSGTSESCCDAALKACAMVRKRISLLHRHFILKTIILPRQARDKHRESTQKRERRVFNRS